MDASSPRPSRDSRAAAAGAPRSAAAGALGRVRGHPGALGTCSAGRSERKRVVLHAGRAPGARASDANIGGDDGAVPCEARSAKPAGKKHFSSGVRFGCARRFEGSPFATWLRRRLRFRQIGRERRFLSARCSFGADRGSRPNRAHPNARRLRPTLRSRSSCPPSLPPPPPQQVLSPRPARPRGAGPGPRRRIARFPNPPPPLALPCARRPCPWTPRRAA